MFLWFVFGAIFGVWNVFQSPGSTSGSSRWVRCARC